MALPGGGFDAGGQRRSKLDYGNDLRAQIEANRYGPAQEKERGSNTPRSFVS